MTEQTTQMFREAAQAAHVVQTQLEINQPRMEQLRDVLHELAPRAIVTCARGSSDHAATFAKYLIETRTGILTSSAAPSVSSVYATKANLRGTVFLAISQSGASPDLLASLEMARAAGACTLAFVNAEDSPLARLADFAVPLCAGAEVSVAATKSYIASLAAIVHLVALWSSDHELLKALEHAPEQLARAWELDWSSASERLTSADDLYVLGRGLGLGVAQEAALKLKETCGLHAEGLSAAEVKHGPMALIDARFPVMLLAQNDETRAGSEALAATLVARGAPVFVAGGRCPGAVMLPTEASHPAIEPMLMIQSFYRMANALSLARGFDPDRPPHLHKVTETV
jgi:glutamine---fructose-6-phosphate transaminase (isomerizing)